MIEEAGKIKSIYYFIDVMTDLVGVVVSEDWVYLGLLDTVLLAADDPLEFQKHLIMRKAP